MGNRSWLKETEAERTERAALDRRERAIKEFADFHKGLTLREKEELASFIEKYDKDEALLLHAIRLACCKS